MSEWDLRASLTRLQEATNSLVVLYTTSETPTEEARMSTTAAKFSMYTAAMSLALALILLLQLLVNVSRESKVASGVTVASGSGGGGGGSGSGAKVQRLQTLAAGFVVGLVAGSSPSTSPSTAKSVSHRSVRETPVLAYMPPLPSGLRPRKPPIAGHCCHDLR